jgi:hypothetical protein
MIYLRLQLFVIASESLDIVSVTEGRWVVTLGVADWPAEWLVRRVRTCVGFTGDLSRPMYNDSTSPNDPGLG